MNFYYFTNKEFLSSEEQGEIIIISNTDKFQPIKWKVYEKSSTVDFRNILYDITALDNLYPLELTDQTMRYLNRFYLNDVGIYFYQNLNEPGFGHFMDMLKNYNKS